MRVGSGDAVPDADAMEREAEALEEGDEKLLKVAKPLGEETVLPLLTEDALAITLEVPRKAETDAELVELAGGDGVASPLGEASVVVLDNADGVAFAESVGVLVADASGESVLVGLGVSRGEEVAESDELLMAVSVDNAVRDDVALEDALSEITPEEDEAAEALAEPLVDAMAVFDEDALNKLDAVTCPDAVVLPHVDGVALAVAETDTVAPDDAVLLGDAVPEDEPSRETVAIELSLALLLANALALEKALALEQGVMGAEALCEGVEVTLRGGERVAVELRDSRALRLEDLEGAALLELLPLDETEDDADAVSELTLLLVAAAEIDAEGEGLELEGALADVPADVVAALEVLAVPVDREMDGRALVDAVGEVRADTDCTLLVKALAVVLGEKVFVLDEFAERDSRADALELRLELVLALEDLEELGDFDATETVGAEVVVSELEGRLVAVDDGDGFELKEAIDAEGDVDMSALILNRDALVSGVGIDETLGVREGTEGDGRADAVADVL